MAKALQMLAGYSRIEAIMLSMHPDQDDVLNIVSAVQPKKASGATPVFTTVGKQENAVST